MKTDTVCCSTDLSQHTACVSVCTLVYSFDFDLARLAATRKRLQTSLTASPKSSWICPCNLLEKRRSTADIIHKYSQTNFDL